MKTIAIIALFALFAGATAQKHMNEIKYMPGHTKLEDYTLPRPHEYVNAADVPQQFTWANVNGTSFVTKSLNQHLPQYCGSCWAHGAMSALADRIKIARKAQGDDINLAIQYILNCGTQVAGSCYGGSASGAYQFVKESDVGIPYDTCLQYEACSADSNEGFCASTDRQCNAMNTCRTCSTFTSMGGKCVGLTQFPNATIAEYGSVTGMDQMQAEILKRGPIACGVNANAILHYTGGVLDLPNEGKDVDHIISIIGWGYDNALSKPYWIIRNSWGQYWGELGYFRVVAGENQLGLESQCSWATPASFSLMGPHCDEDGTGCVSSMTYRDPAHDHM